MGDREGGQQPAAGDARRREHRHGDRRSDHGPLLLWAIRTVEEFSDDILSAWAERNRLRAAAAANIATPASRAALRAFMDRIDAGQLPIPTTQWLGRTTIAGAYIAGSCSMNCPSPTPRSGRCRPSRSRAGATESLPGSPHGVAGCVARFEIPQLQSLVRALS